MLKSFSYLSKLYFPYKVSSEVSINSEKSLKDAYSALLHNYDGKGGFCWAKRPKLPFFIGLKYFNPRLNLFNKIAKIDYSIEDKKNQYYLGHVQAPTSSQRKWHYDTSHPFETMSWMVFHNGVITNEEAIRNYNIIILKIFKHSFMRKVF